jgi:undecaprenyl-diphosphatase
VARSIAEYDACIDALVERVRKPSLDHLAFALSSAADHSLLWHAIGWTRAARTGRVADAARLSCALGIESFLTNVVIKSAFGRLRPAREPTSAPLPYGMRVPVTSAFPSGHATAAFTAAVFLGSGKPFAQRAGWYGLAASVAASRVYVRMHHASDVAAGSVLGLVMGRALRARLAR